MAQQKLPFRKWVPYWLRIVVGFAILLPITLINGAYTGCSIDISSALGVMSEDITMAYYAASAGMAAAYPLIPKVRPIATTKTILLSSLVSQVILSLLCANTGSMEILIICSFLIGTMKAFSMLEMIIILKPVFSRRDIRSEFYSYFYPIVFGAGQVSMLLTSELAYNYQWQYMYYAVSIMLLIAIMLILICFRYGRRPIRIPFKEMDFKSFLYISVAMLMTIYLFTYGKVSDWFESPLILCFTLVIPLLVWLFIKAQQGKESPFVNLDVIKYKKSIVGYLFMSITMILSASSALVSSYTSSVLKLDSVHSNGLNLMMIPGFIAGAFICFWWFRLQIWRFRVLVFWGLACFVGYFGLLYFGVTADGSFEYLYLPTMLRGMGMIILFIAFGVYAVEGMNPKLMISNAFFLVTTRSMLAPVIGASLFSNMLYRVGQRNSMILGQELSATNTIAASKYDQYLNSAISGGQPLEQAQVMATSNLNSLLSVQANLLTIKMILGYMLIISIVLMIIARFTPFHRTLSFRVVKSGEDMA